MDAKERLMLIQEEMRLNGASLARHIGVNPEALKSIRVGKVNKVSIELANAIVEKFPQYNKLWILTGEGDKLAKSEPEPTSTNQTDQLIQVLLERMKDVNDQMTENTAILRRSQDLFERVLELYEKKVKQADYNPAANYNIAAETIADNSTGNNNK